MERIYKECTCCRHTWASRIDLVLDGHIGLIGYQPPLAKGIEGLFFFSHDTKDCGTTIAVPANDFSELYDGPEHIAQLNGADQCSGLCQSFFDFGECTHECAIRWVRDVLQILRKRGPAELLARLDKQQIQKRCA